MLNKVSSFFLKKKNTVPIPQWICSKSIWETMIWIDWKKLAWIEETDEKKKESKEKEKSCDFLKATVCLIKTSKTNHLRNQKLLKELLRLEQIQESMRYWK